jgi:UDP-N-acetylglucosamine 1-carboxyvinyltransferase
MLAAAAAANRPVDLYGVPQSADVEIMQWLISRCGRSVSTLGRATTIAPGRHPEAEPDLSKAADLFEACYLITPVLASFGRIRLPWPADTKALPRVEAVLGVHAAFGDAIETSADGYTVTAGEPPQVVRITLTDQPSATIAALLRAQAGGTSLILEGADSSPATLGVLAALNVHRARAASANAETVQLTLTPSRAAASSLHWIVPPDLLQTATLACALAATGGSGEVAGADVDAPGLRALINMFERAGLAIKAGGGRLTVDGSAPTRPRTRAVGIRLCGDDGTLVPPDLEPLLLVLSLMRPGTHLADRDVVARRTVLIRQLERLGAAIDLPEGIARIRGPQHLTGASVASRTASDLAALAVAALTAQGATTLHYRPSDWPAFPATLAKIAELGGPAPPVPSNSVPPHSEPSTPNPRIPTPGAQR